LLLLAATSAAGLPQTASGSVNAEGANEAFLVEDHSIKVVVQNDGTAVREEQTQVRIQSDASLKRFGVVAVPYQSSVEEVEIRAVRVRRSDGTIVATPLESVLDMPAEVTRLAPYYSDLREKHVSVKGLGVGDLLEWQTVVRVTRPLVPGQFWLSASFIEEASVLHEELQLSVPRERAISWSSRTIQPVITDAGGRRLFSWTRGPQKRTASEETKERQAENRYLSARGKLPWPDIEVSTFGDWNTVGTWYRSLSRPRVSPSSDIREKALELTKGATDDNARIAALYGYVSTQVRYIGVAFGIGRYQPHSASEVLANQYGDCKDKHTLLASLLEAVGIEANAALINSGHEIDTSVPSPGQFDHVITAIPREGSLLWLDTTPEVAPLGYLAGRLRDKKALLLRRNGPATFVTTVADPPTRGLETFHIKARLDQTGTLEGRIERSVTGVDDEVQLRGAFRGVPTTGWKDLIQLISMGSGFAGEVSDTTASDPAKTDEPMRWSYMYKRENFPDWPTRRVADALPPITLPDPDDRPSQPVWLGSPLEVKFDSILDLPEGSVPRVPPRVDLEEDFAEYHCARSLKGRVLTTERRFLLKQREVSLERQDRYKRFAKAVQEDQATLIGLSPQARLTAATYQFEIVRLPESEKPDAVRAFADAGNARDTLVVVSALRRAVTVDPTYTRAWLVLGEIYKFEKKSDQSLKAYRSAIEGNPREPLGYKVLAFNLSEAQRFDEAATVWKRLIDLAPQDPDALDGLADALMGAKRYSEAIPVLESAIAQSPERPELSLHLGVAAAKAGEDKKSRDALQTALSMEPEAEDLNSTAYSLVMSGKQLPIALQCVERAVKKKEVESSKVTLSDLKQDDLIRMRTLAAYWDTAGWVYFRLGKLDRAEKYLDAAWSLSQDATIGDHLGQVLEKQGKSEEAAHTYRLALATHPKKNSMKETEGRLESLEKGVASGFSASEELTRLRTCRLSYTSKDFLTAEYFVLLGPNFKTLDAKFISGDAGLRGAAMAVKAASYRTPLPDGGPTRLVRRGVLACGPSSGCTIVFYTPDLVISTE
jgi:tetratricopeptide (TPR) repeat protein